MVSRRWRGRARVAQAMLLLTAAGAAQKVVPMARWSRIIGRHAAVPEKWGVGATNALPLRSADIEEERVRRAIMHASSRLPWNPTCLAEATAGQVMLRRRHRPGVVVIGLRPTAEVWDAHAWLMGRCGALTGGPAASGFTATAVFEVPDGLRVEDIDLA
jgi:hypothetical protein